MEKLYKNQDTVAEIEEKVSLANKAKLRWKELGVKKRVELLMPVYAEFRKRANEFAPLITREMGKPITQSRNEVEGSLNDFKWFMDNGEKALADEITHEDKASLQSLWRLQAVRHWQGTWRGRIQGALPD